MQVHHVALCLITLTIMSEPALADDKARPTILQSLVDCKKIADMAERVACYDTHVTALDEAERAKNVVVIDKARMKEARKGIFGLTLPSLTDIIGGGSDDNEAEEITQIESTIQRVSRSPSGRWVFIIEDGAKWVQTDQRDLVDDPRTGQKIAIRRASMGSFLANVDGQTAIRVRREN